MPVTGGSPDAKRLDTVAPKKTQGHSDYAADIQGPRKTFFGPTRRWTATGKNDEVEQERERAICWVAKQSQGAQITFAVVRTLTDSSAECVPVLSTPRRSVGLL